MKRSLLVALAVLGALVGAGGLRAILAETNAIASPAIHAHASSESASPSAAPAEPPAAAIAAPAPSFVAPPAVSAAPRPAAQATGEEAEAEYIDDLVASGDLGEAHAAAMDFVQEHPTGPFTAHVMNLMGVHPRPAGAVPQTSAMEK
jgi:hypothetical protein